MDNIDKNKEIDDIPEEVNDANFLPADHHLLEKMQKALNKQLVEELDRNKLNLLQKTKILESLEKEKEEIGVRLYES